MSKLDPKAYIGFFVGYESTNIYWIKVSIKKKVVSIRNIIFDKNTVLDRKPIFYFDNNIKELDKAIIYIEISEFNAKEIEDI